ncbi:MAG: helix-turn-helix domain-containing protein [Chloroflexi bacterium]|nr:helix-turn-helix domain-containing protein [Chloroflexota bacterium]
MSEAGPNNGHRPTDANLRAAQDSMLDGLGQLSDYFGFSKVMGQLYGALLLSPEPLSLDDLLELLDISKASVSMNLRTLEHMGMVRQVWVRGRGGRRKYYEAETDFWTIISNILAGREMRDVERALHVMDDNIERLSNALPDMNPEDQRLAELYVERIQQMQSLFRFAQLIITTILSQAGNTDLSNLPKLRSAD